MDSSQLTGLRDHYFKQQKKDFLVISEKENYPDLKLTEREACAQVSKCEERLTEIHKNVVLFQTLLILILSDRCNFFEGMDSGMDIQPMSKACNNVKTPTSQRTQNLVYLK